MLRVHFSISTAALVTAFVAVRPAFADPAAKPSTSEVVAGVPLPPDQSLPTIENSWHAIIGARGDLTHAAGNQSHTAGGAQFAASFDGFASLGSGITRIAFDAGIGGGGAGVEGELGLAFFGGKRWDIVDHGGPFVRIGGEGHFAGNDLLYDSRLIVPELEAGFQVMQSPGLVDVALYAGPMLDGRAGIGDDSRRLAESLAYGARAAVHRGYAFLTLDVGLDTPSHGFSDQSLFALGRACYAIFPTSICLDARVLHADEGDPSAHAVTGATAEQLGVMFGLGL